MCKYVGGGGFNWHSYPEGLAVWALVLLQLGAVPPACGAPSAPRLLQGALVNAHTARGGPASQCLELEAGAME